MARRKNGKDKIPPGLHPEVRRTVLVITLIAAAFLMILAALGEAGPLGQFFFISLSKLFGLGYYLLPGVAFLFAFACVAETEKSLALLTVIGGLIFILSGLGFLDILSPGKGGFAGSLVGALETPLGAPASLITMICAIAASFLIILNRPLKVSRLLALARLGRKKPKQIKIVTHEREEESGGEEKSNAKDADDEEPEDDEDEKKQDEIHPPIVAALGDEPIKGGVKPILLKNYIPPPASLLLSAVEKPTVGDLRANANVIKRTLESFGISVDMGEINVGPTVARYTLKPAEGVKIARITTLNQDLALALAAHPIRIEAPIPGRSLVGIEVPNKSSAIVRLGSLILYQEFQKSPPLTFAVGRNVNGEPIFADIARMPHLLIAGATGSGKSIALHSLIMSLLFKNSPDMLRLILIDPKRIELSIYNGIPHLLSPVITENKKAMAALRWAVSEMERRYQILMEAGSRDIAGYNVKKRTDQLPFIVVVIDEMADLMISYGREMESAIIRLAQMARATGLHLIVSTQRPSVEVITGLIKANITSRLALQVASQIDSRTILDSSGAEKLLGRGDLLFVTSEFSKPKRIQGSFISEEELKRVVAFIKEKNQSLETERESEPEDLDVDDSAVGGKIIFDSGSDADLEDELYEEAVEAVRSAKKASASLLQRRLRIGYARAARLLDIMEERGVVGPGEGAKPREVMV